MKNLFISDLDQKDAEHFTTNIGLMLRRRADKPFKKLCNIFTNANIIKVDNSNVSDDEYFTTLSTEKIPLSRYDLNPQKNNIVLERYPQLDEDEQYIFVCNHTCPEDIENVLNILDRNAYLVLGSIETLKYNPEAYLTWLNGMIPFDILDKEQRKGLMSKMERVLKTNSILIFPEGSHNYSPNNLVNNLFDGPVNLSLKTGKKIVVVTHIKDKENSVSYIDVSNPVDLESFGIEKDGTYTNATEREKHCIKSLTSCIRDKMATAVYYILARHIAPVKRSDYQTSDIEEYWRQEKIADAFKKLKWDHDVFDAEYLVKKTQADREHEEVIHTLSNLRFNQHTLANTLLGNREWVLLENDLQRKDVASSMRAYWLRQQGASSKEKVLTKRK